MYEKYVHSSICLHFTILIFTTCFFFFQFTFLSYLGDDSAIMVGVADSQAVGGGRIQAAADCCAMQSQTCTEYKSASDRT